MFHTLVCNLSLSFLSSSLPRHPYFFLPSLLFFPSHVPHSFQRSLVWFYTVLTVSSFSPPCLIHCFNALPLCPIVILQLLSSFLFQLLIATVQLPPPVSSSLTRQSCLCSFHIVSLASFVDLHLCCASVCPVTPSSPGLMGEGFWMVCECKTKTSHWSAISPKKHVYVVIGVLFKHHWCIITTAF